MGQFFKHAWPDAYCLVVIGQLVYSNPMFKYIPKIKVILHCGRGVVKYLIRIADGLKLMCYFHLLIAFPIDNFIQIIKNMNLVPLFL
jgi:hypothetical protein